MYNSTLSLTSEPEGVGKWSTPRPGHFTPRKETWYPLYSRLNGTQHQPRQVQKISHPPDFDSQNTQPIPSRYNDYAILAHRQLSYFIILLLVSSSLFHSQSFFKLHEWLINLLRLQSTVMRPGLQYQAV